jgi:hypothetical protein
LLISAKAYRNIWAGATPTAIDAGARHPELVAAQWALETGHREDAQGPNHVGLKDERQTLATEEEVKDGSRGTIKNE